MLGILALLFLTALAADLVFVVQGAWSKASLGASEAQLGQVFALLGISWLLFLPLYVLFALCLEVSIVSALPLASGVAPAVRGTVLALCVLMNGMGRAVGSRIATPLWLGAGIGATGLVSAALIALGVLLCWALVHEREGATLARRGRSSETHAEGQRE